MRRLAEGRAPQIQSLASISLSKHVLHGEGRIIQATRRTKTMISPAEANCKKQCGPNETKPNDITIT